MRKLMLLLMISPMFLLTTGCQTYQVHPFELGYIHPYDQACHFKNVITKKIRNTPQGTGKGQCDMRRMLLIPIESARTVLDDLQINCHLSQCTQIKGAGDSILIAIDQGLNKIPF